MEFRKPLTTKWGAIKTAEEALRFIERELPSELKAQSRWAFAQALLIEAARTEKKCDLKCAYRQFRQALENDRLAPDIESQQVQ